MQVNIEYDPETEQRKVEDFVAGRPGAAADPALQKEVTQLQAYLAKKIGEQGLPTPAQKAYQDVATIINGWT